MSGIISLSGTILIGNAEQGFDLNPRTRAVELGRALNCTDLNDNQLLVDCLRNASASDIALVQPAFSPSLETLPEDGNLTSVFFPDKPINLIMNGKANDVPWMVGVTSAEAIRESYSKSRSNMEKVFLNIIFCHYSKLYSPAPQSGRSHRTQYKF